MNPGSHLGYLEMGHYASLAVWLWGPHLDTSILDKTCRIRFCNNDEHLQPGAPCIVSTRQCIPVSPHSGTTEATDRPVPVQQSSGILQQRGWGPPSLSPISVPPSMLAPGVSHAFCWQMGGRIKVAVSPLKTLRLQSH